MIRFLLSIIILTIIITYVIIPLVNFIKGFVRSEGKRIDEVFNPDTKTKFIKRKEENK